MLRRAARDRPAIAILDDVQWGHETLEMARALLAAPDPGPEEAAAPRLLVLTRPGGPEWAGSALGAPDRVEHIEVGPLAPGDRPALVRALLGLDGAAAAEVEERTGGHPLFAVQLVGYWAERGLLVPGAGGHELRPGAEARVPADLRALWAERVQDLLEGRPASDRPALELGAALGADVDGDEWQRALRAAGLEPSPALVDGLVGAGLGDWRSDGSGWSFAHGMLVDALRHSCRKGGRWSEFNRVCAAILADSDEPEAPERRGRHLIVAGETAAACDLLLGAARRRGREGGFRREARLLDERAAALDALGLDVDAPARLQGRLLRARLTTSLGDPAAGERLAESAEKGARAARRSDLVADALLVRGKTRGILGDQPLARAHLEEAASLFERLGDELGGAHCALQRGVTFTREGKLTRADVSIRAALEVFERLNEPYEAAIACGHLSIVAQQAGRLDEAQMIVERGLVPAEAHGHRHVAANLHIALGEALRHKGDLDRAERAYGTAMAIYRSFGTADLGLLECNVAQIHLARGSFEQARALLAPTLATFEARGRANRAAATGILLLPCEAHDRRWAAFDEHIERATTVFSTTHYAELDIAVTAEQAAELAEAVGQGERAAAARELAALQWDALERPDDARRVRLRGAEPVGVQAI